MNLARLFFIIQFQVAAAIDFSAAAEPPCKSELQSQINIDSFEEGLYISLIDEVAAGTFVDQYTLEASGKLANFSASLIFNKPAHILLKHSW